MMKRIKLLAMDVDGTLTDGKIYMSANGEAFKAFDIKDGYTIYTLNRIGIVPVIITGRESHIVTQRAKELKIGEIYQGVSNKIEKLREIAARYDATLEEVAYFGDDYNDEECMKSCGYSGCPHNAEEDIKQSCNYICQLNGGEGALREFVKTIVNNRI